MLTRTPWVDPRRRPKPKRRRGRAARTSSNADDVTELHHLCRTGRLYDIEDWIRSGRPLQLTPSEPAKGRRATAMQLALESGSFALVYLLICNGYDVNLDPRSPLDLALRGRRADLVDLLLDWGADPLRVSLPDLFETYSSQLFERFFALGVDFTTGHALASMLAYHPSNKPLFGFVRRHREGHAELQRELNIALGHHVDARNAKGVHLCLWAGADAHTPAPSLDWANWRQESDTEGANGFVGFTAVEAACRTGDSDILRRLRPDPARDDFDELFAMAANGAIVRTLYRHGAPRSVAAVIRSQLVMMDGFRPWRPSSNDALVALFDAGARWVEASTDDVTRIRHALLRVSDAAFSDAMKLLAKSDHCAGAILHDIARTPALRARLVKVGFTYEPSVSRGGVERPRPTRWREVLTKLGVTPPSRQRRLPPTVHVGRWYPGARELRFDRQALYERAWSEPIERLALRWGLSGPGLAKALRRLEIPVPPRGFWAKVRSGGRCGQARLPELPAGEATEILIHCGKEADGSGTELPV